MINKLIIANKKEFRSYKDLKGEIEVFGFHHDSDSLFHSTFDVVKADN